MGRAIYYGLLNNVPRLLQRGLFCAMFMLGRLGMAQEAIKPISQYVHTVWRTEEGLPQNSVQAILQTRDGYLWVGTQEGLVRFNGTHFTRFNKTNVDAIRHNDIRALLEDRQGYLWIGTSGGGVVRYRDGVFKAFREEDGLSNNYVNALLEDKSGKIWIATNKGLNWYISDNIVNVGIKDGLSNGTVNSLAVAQNGDVWVGSNAGVDRFPGGIFHPANVEARFKTEVIKTVYVDRSNVVWIGTNQIGLYAFASGWTGSGKNRLMWC